MSIHMMSDVWTLRDVSTHDKIVLLAIADHADSNGCGWPSVSLLSKKCSMSERGVRKILHRLSDAGYLEIEPRKRRGGQDTNLYRLIIDDVSKTIPPAQGAYPPAQGAYPPAQGAYHGTIKEPSNNQNLADPKPSAETDVNNLQYRWFVSWFCWVYLQTTGDKYAFRGSDAKQVKELLHNNGLMVLLQRSTYWLFDADRFPRGTPDIKGLYAGWNRMGGRDGIDTAAERGLLPPTEVLLSSFTPWMEQTT